MASHPVSVVTARLDRTPDGVPWSAEFRDIYHSGDGGLAQARHVFLDGNALPERWRRRERFTILETGFGLGLNFLAAWERLRADPEGPQRLHFVSVERHPFTAQELAEALVPFTEIAPLARALSDHFPPPVAGFHRMHFDAGRVSLTLILGDAREQLPQLEARADAIFLDGFAPARNPELWSPEVVREIARLAAPGATLATWTVAGGVRAALAGAGFRVQRREGFGHKREMLVGVRDGDPQAEAGSARRALVVGGGLAGILAAERLALRGWDIVLVESRKRRANARAGLVRPVANVRDATNAQVSRPAFLYALHHFAMLQRDGYHLVWNRSGALQLAEGENEARRFEAIAGSQGWPPEMLAYVDVAEASRLAGREVRGAGWWMPRAACVSPESLAIAHLARAGSRVRPVTGRVHRIEREGGHWRAFAQDGAMLGEAPVLVLANALDCARLAPETRLPFHAVRGQVTYLPDSPARRLDVVVSGSGYVAPLEGGGHVIGATYGHDDPGEDVRAADHRENLAKAESMLPGFTHDVHPMALEGWAGHRTTVPDRMPVFGQTAMPGVWVAAGLGSRGLLWGPLGAELLASRLSGDPSPLPRDLAGALSPRRFLS
jgi:tRNA 5-methylaminomethyl-2-thiouridine biosynthesis bifunctional protein